MRLIGRLYERYEKASAWEHNIAPRIRKDIDKTTQDSSLCTIIYVEGDEHKVRDGYNTFLVNLNIRSCGYNS